MKGSFRVGAVDEEGRNQIGDLEPGDVWYFPSGVPHYIQALSKGGGEFLLVFDDGNFSEDSTLLLTDFTAHIPREVVVKVRSPAPHCHASELTSAPFLEFSGAHQRRL
jgi:oxalate decarboxylase